MADRFTIIDKLDCRSDIWPIHDVKKDTSHLFFHKKLVDMHDFGQF